VRAHYAPHFHAGLHIAAPVKTAKGVWLLPMSRALRDVDGGLRAVLIATVNLDGFSALYDARRPNDLGASLGLVDERGRQLVRVPFVETVMGERRLGGTQIVQREQA